MKVIYIRFLFFLFLLSGIQNINGQSTNLYRFKLAKVDTDSVDFNLYRGKIILIVNIASKSPKSMQLDELNQLSKWYKDSGLIIIGIASNSFNNEPGSNKEIEKITTTQYKVNFPIVTKSEIRGALAVPLYQWLTRKTENGVFDSEVKADFQKYLINTKGELVGVFVDKINPLNVILLNALRNAK